MYVYFNSINVKRLNRTGPNLLGNPREWVVKDDKFCPENFLTNLKRKIREILFTRKNDSLKSNG